MAMGQHKDRQGDLMVSWSEMPRSPGHVFYDCLQSVLIKGERVVVDASTMEVNAALGHNKVQTTTRYTHLTNHPLTAAADRIASRIANAWD